MRRTLFEMLTLVNEWTAKSQSSLVAGMFINPTAPTIGILRAVERAAFKPEMAYTFVFCKLVAYSPKVVVTADGLIVTVSKNTADNTSLCILRNTERIPIKANEDFRVLSTALSLSEMFMSFVLCGLQVADFITLCPVLRLTFSGRLKPFSRRNSTKEFRKQFDVS